MCFVVFIGVNFLNAQQFSIKDRITFSTRDYKAKILTTSNLEVVYKLTYLPNVKKPNSKRIEFLRLVIGDDYSKFNEYKREVRNSLEEVFSHQKTIENREFGLFSEYSGHWKKDILKDYKSNKYSLQQFLVDYFEFEDTLPKFNWTLLNDTKEISGYLCHKASTDYRGRSYTAWYTKDIPVNDGPYIFHGLPGLILHLEDYDQHYVFSLEGLKKLEKPIYWRDEKRWVKISMKEFYKLEKATFDNPGFYIKSKAMDANGNVIEPKFPPKPYNPIERD